MASSDRWATAEWRKSTRSGGNGGECVEVARVGELVGVRDSKDPDGPVLEFGLSQWRAFIRGVRDGEFGG